MPLPRVSHHFLVCTNVRAEDGPLPSCGPRGGADVYQTFVRELARRGYPAGVKVTATGCLTPCQHGPTVVVYPEQTWYRGVSVTDVTEILTAHIDRGGPVERLLLPPDVRVT